MAVRITGKTAEGGTQVEMGAPDSQVDNRGQLIPSAGFLKSMELTEFNPAAEGLSINTETAGKTTPDTSDLAVGPFQMRLNMVEEAFAEGAAEGLVEPELLERFQRGNDQERAGLLVTNADKLLGVIAEKTQREMGKMGAELAATVTTQNLYHNAPIATRTLVDRYFGSATAFKQRVDTEGPVGPSRELLEKTLADPLTGFKTPRSRQIFKNRIKNLLDNVDQLEDPNLDPATLGDELHGLWQRYHPQPTEQQYQEQSRRDLQMIEDTLVGVVPEPQSQEEVYQTTNHVVEQLVANPLMTGDYTRGAIGRWMYGGTDAERDQLPETLTPHQFLTDVLGIPYPESATKDLKFDKDVPALVNIMGWMSAASIEAIRQVPLVATDLATDPLMFMTTPAVASLGNPEKFGSHVWSKVKEWLGGQSKVKKQVNQALGVPTQHMPNAFEKFEQMRADMLQKRINMFEGSTRPIHQVFEEANRKLGGSAKLKSLVDQQVDNDTKLLDLTEEFEQRTEARAARLEDQEFQELIAFQRKLHQAILDREPDYVIARLEDEFEAIGERFQLEQSFIEIPEEIRTLQKVHDDLEQAIQAQAGAGRWTKDDFRMLGYNNVLNDTDQAAFILYLTDEANMVLDAAQSGNTKKFFEALRGVSEDLIINQGTRTASGRAQRILQADQAEAMKRWSKDLAELFNNRKYSPQELMRNVAKMDRPQDLLKMVQDSQRPGLIAMIAEMSVNGLLGGATTLVVNAASAPMMIAYHALERTAAGLFAWNKPGMKDFAGKLRGSGMAKREGVDFITGSIQAAGDGLRAFKKAWKMQDALTPGTKLDTFRQHAITGENVAAMLGGPFDTPIVKWMMDGYGTLTRLPGRALLATDEMNKVMIFRGEVKALSNRVARDEAVRLYPNDPQAALAHFDKVKADVIANPENYKDVMRAGIKRGQQLTFTNPSDFAWVKDYSEFTSRHPGLRLVTPFVNVPVNILQTGLGMMPTTPALRLMHDFYKKGLATNDPVKRQMIMGKLAVSVGLATGVGASILSGHLTGAGPADPQQRRLMEAAGWRPYSWKYDSDDDGIPDQYIQLDRLDPFSFMVGVYTDFYESAGWLEGVDDGTGPKEAGWYANKFAQDFSLAMLSNVEDATFISSATKFFEMVTAIGSRDKDKIGRATAQFSQALTPFSGTLKMVNRAISPEMREVREWVDGMRAVVPGLSTTSIPDDHPMKPFYPGSAPVLAQSYSALGQPQTWNNGLGPADLPNWLSEYVPDAAQVVANIINPVRTSSNKDTRLQEIAKVFLANDVELSRPDRQKDGFDIPILHYDAVQKLAAVGIEGVPDEIREKLSKTDMGRKLLELKPAPLVDVLHEMINHENFKKAGLREQKQALVSAKATSRRNWAFQILLEIDPQLKQDYEEHLLIIKSQGQPAQLNTRQGAF